VSQETLRLGAWASLGIFVHVLLSWFLRELCNHFGSHWILFQFYMYGLLVYDSYFKVLNFSRFWEIVIINAVFILIGILFIKKISNIP